MNDIFALSADGTVVAGRLTAPVLNVQPAYRHVVGEGSTYALLGNTNYAGAPVVSGSDDLRTIAFNDLPFPYYPPEPAYLWREGQPILAIYPLPGGVINRVVSVSGDGRVLVGGDWAENTPAWRWTEEEGIQSIGYLPGGLVAAVATACSSDGSIIAGYSSSENWGGDRASREAFLWTAQAGMRGLGDLPGGRVVSKPTDMSADGSVIVGYGETGVGTIFGVDAFIWDQAHGMRNLRDVLVNEYGLASALEGWRLTDAWAISADGRVIAGNGINPAGQHDAWVVYLDGRPPPDCRADFNRNGMVNSQDFFDFLTDFFTAAPRADYNGDGAITSQDFLDYLAAFFAGC